MLIKVNLDFSFRLVQIGSGHFIASKHTQVHDTLAIWMMNSSHILAISSWCVHEITASTGQWQIDLCNRICTLIWCI